MRLRIVRAGRLSAVLSAFVIGIGTIAAGAAPQPAKPVKQELPKTVKFNKDEQSFRDVFYTVAEQTGIPFIGSMFLGGKVTFPDSASKEFTVPEVIDIMNQRLLRAGERDNWYIVHRPRCFIIWAADEPFDYRVMPRVTAEDLVNRGKTEPVTLVLPLTRLDAQKIAPQVKKMIGPLGDVVPVKENGLNQLLLCDTVGNLTYIRKKIEEMEKNAKPR